MYKFNIVKDSTELRKLIAENPELPIVVMTSYEATSDEWYWTYCSIVRCEVGEVLDCKTPWKEGIVYSDRTEFEEDLADYLSDTIENSNKLSDEEFNNLVATQKDVYEEYWHKAIIIKADN
jgi:hypothetical protein